MIGVRFTYRHFIYFELFTQIGWTRWYNIFNEYSRYLLSIIRNVYLTGKSGKEMLIFHNCMHQFIFISIIFVYTVPPTIETPNDAPGARFNSTVFRAGLSIII